MWAAATRRDLAIAQLCESATELIDLLIAWVIADMKKKEADDA